MYLFLKSKVISQLLMRVKTCRAIIETRTLIVVTLVVRPLQFFIKDVINMMGEFYPDIYILSLPCRNDTRRCRRVAPD